tara:strand:+ start:46589 stop:48745 length:2157 start_codon:yes stop_codon:yes gene_type:complete
MAERSFKKEVEQLRLGAGETFSGEGILAITKALLESGVGYVGGYQGAPISALMDVLADAEELMAELGVAFRANASEAAATAMLAASVHYPLRGAVAFKSPVGMNVASDALANLASGGVTGGAMLIIGEDYGEGSAIMQERVHAFAMKSQVWLLDPRPNLPSMTKLVRQGFELSEASETPVIFELRIRACHVHGSFEASDNCRPSPSVAEAKANPKRDLARVAIPPAAYQQERDKIEKRLPAARAFIRANALNEVFGPGEAPVGLILQGGMYNQVLRALQHLGLATLDGQTDVPLYVLNVTYPLVPEEVHDFIRGKDCVLVIEEGQPNHIEEAITTLTHKANIETRIEGKEHLPMAGEYTSVVVEAGLTGFFRAHASHLLTAAHRAPNEPRALPEGLGPEAVPARPPSFCIGCPERPIMAATKLVQDEVGEMQIAGDIGCHLFAILPPFNLGGTTMGFGLGPASNAAFSAAGTGRRVLSFMGDGGFWHNGLSSSIGNAVFNKTDDVIVIVDNFYSAATGGQDILSSRAENPTKSTQHPLEKAVRGVGVEWVRQIDRTYDVPKMKALLHEAMTTDFEGPKVIIASSECMLNRQRRERPERARKMREGESVTVPRFGVDEAVCTGDHACIRLSGCPSLTLKHTDDILRDDPVAHIDEDCVGCGNCGEVADAAVLCPSFYRVDVEHNASAASRMFQRMSDRIIGALQNRRAARRIQFDVEAL